MRIDILSVLPDVFEAPLSASMLGIARSSGALDLHVHDLRGWALPGVHRQVDDAPYGGGPGMVLRCEPVFDAVRAISAEGPPPLVVLLTPQGRTLDQPLVEDLAARERLLLVCGRYEGFDERVRSLADLQLSIGDYVLTGGELPAMIVVDAVARLLPGVLGGETSAEEESFSWGLLEYPQYTRPPQYEGMRVPDILLSGDHARVRAWRRTEAVRRTALLRPDLLDAADLTPEERDLVDRITTESTALEETE
ncbi:MAG: tRNA (guanosine(37)-N1)-methyltransferase TrmD [Actinobacteria bacterium]|nr:MAG: tRNA (guanosine(37)-N1)-methyltransferase TrmD [Actinomycetota bacterium]